MRKTIVTCDRCGKEIKCGPIKINFEVVDRETGENCNNEYPHSDYFEDKDFCEDCINYLFGLVKGKVEKGAPAQINGDFEEAVQEMAQSNTDEPVKEEITRKKKALDIGKIKALRNAGWTAQAIADEVGTTRATIYDVFKRLKSGKITV